MRRELKLYNAVDTSRLVALADRLRARSAPARAQRAGGRSWYRVTNQGNRAEVYIYDMIGEWGITAQDFVGELRDIQASAIDLHLNCEGGEVFDGIAIYNALVNHPAEVTVYVDALAASAASFIAMAGSHRVMAKNARMMIHDASGLCIGNAREMRELADLLDDTSDNIASIYAERTGTKPEDWREAMRNETWYTAQAAVDAGLADAIDGVDPAPQPSSPSDTTQTPGLIWDPAAFNRAVTEALA